MQNMPENYNVLITYDIDSKHTEVRKSLIEDYSFEEKVIASSGKACYLPNTTLYKKYTTKQNALITLQSVCKAKGVDLKRVITLECSNWLALPGEKM